MHVPIAEKLPSDKKKSTIVCACLFYTYCSKLPMYLSSVRGTYSVIDTCTKKCVDMLGLKNFFAFLCCTFVTSDTFVDNTYLFDSEWFIPTSFILAEGGKQLSLPQQTMVSTLATPGAVCLSMKMRIRILLTLTGKH